MFIIQDRQLQIVCIMGFCEQASNFNVRADMEVEHSYF